MKTRLFQCFSVLTLIFAVSSFSFCAEVNITDKIKISKESLGYDKENGITSCNFLLKSKSKNAYTGPFKVVIEETNNPNVSIVNPSGYTRTGKPYFAYLDQNLPPRGKTTSLNWVFGHACKSKVSVKFKPYSATAIKLQKQCSKQVTLYITVFSEATFNHPPVADAGLDQDVTVGTIVTLDGRNSSDPDGDPITYQWTMAEVPSGSVANTG